MSYTLEECWNATNLKTKLMTVYNAVDTVTPLSETEATTIVSLCKLGLGALKECEVVYSTTAIGDSALQDYISFIAFPLVRELRAQVKALSTDMGKQHTQVKFNPIDNEDIESGTIATDDLSFNYAQNMLTNTDFLISNTKALRSFIAYIKRDILMVI